jgi:tetratricopeptide (TPR) repeat protein
VIKRDRLFSKEASALLKNTGWYLMEHARYMEAEPLLKQAEAIGEQQVSMTPLDAATSFNDLAELYWRLGRYAEAESLVRHALSIREQQLGPEHPNTAIRAYPKTERQSH